MKSQDYRLILVGFALAAAATAGAENTNGSKTSVTSDAEIAAILDAANSSEIEAARLARTHSTNPQVTAFASKMIDQHSKNESSSDALTDRLNIKTSETQESNTLQSQARAKIDDLKTKSGTEFDKAYIDSQVSMHTQVANDLRTSLIPTAKNAEFKSFLRETLKHVQSHLQEAKKIQASLADASRSATTK